jgi:hypothetical protein
MSGVLAVQQKKPTEYSVGFRRCWCCCLHCGAAGELELLPAEAAVELAAEAAVELAAEAAVELAAEAAVELAAEAAVELAAEPAALELATEAAVELAAEPAALELATEAAAKAAVELATTEANAADAVGELLLLECGNSRDHGHLLDSDPVVGVAGTAWETATEAPLELAAAAEAPLEHAPAAEAPLELAAAEASLELAAAEAPLELASTETPLELAAETAIELAAAEAPLELAAETALELAAQLTAELATQLAAELATQLAAELVLDLLLLVDERLLRWSEGVGGDVTGQTLRAELRGDALAEGRFGKDHETGSQSQGKGRYAEDSSQLEHRGTKGVGKLGSSGQFYLSGSGYSVHRYPFIMTDARTFSKGSLPNLIADSPREVVHPSMAEFSLSKAIGGAGLRREPPHFSKQRGFRFVGAKYGKSPGRIQKFRQMILTGLGVPLLSPATDGDLSHAAVRGTVACGLAVIRARGLGNPRAGTDRGRHPGGSKQ